MAASNKRLDHNSDHRKHQTSFFLVYIVSSQVVLISKFLSSLDIFPTVLIQSKSNRGIKIVLKPTGLPNSLKCCADSHAKSSDGWMGQDVDDIKVKVAPNVILHNVRCPLKPVPQTCVDAL